MANKQKAKRGRPKKTATSDSANGPAKMSAKPKADLKAELRKAFGGVKGKKKPGASIDLAQLEKVGHALEKVDMSKVLELVGTMIDTARGKKDDPAVAVVHSQLDSQLRMHAETCKTQLEMTRLEIGDRTAARQDLMMFAKALVEAFVPVAMAKMENDQARRAHSEKQWAHEERMQELKRDTALAASGKFPPDADFKATRKKGKEDLNGSVTDELS